MLPLLFLYVVEGVTVPTTEGSSGDKRKVDRCFVIACHVALSKTEGTKFTDLRCGPTERVNPLTLCPWMRRNYNPWLWFRTLWVNPTDSKRNTRTTDLWSKLRGHGGRWRLTPHPLYLHEPRRLTRLGAHVGRLLPASLCPLVHVLSGVLVQVSTTFVMKIGTNILSGTKTVNIRL